MEKEDFEPSPDEVERDWSQDPETETRTPGEFLREGPTQTRCRPQIQWPRDAGPQQPEPASRGGARRDVEGGGRRRKTSAGSRGTRPLALTHKWPRQSAGARPPADPTRAGSKRPGRGGRGVAGTWRCERASQGMAGAWERRGPSGHGVLEGPSRRPGRPGARHAETTQDPERPSAEVRRPGKKVKRTETETLKDGRTKKGRNRGLRNKKPGSRG